MAHIITDKTGESKPVVKYYGDGSFDCPFCNNAIIAPKKECENPWCYASKWWTVEELKKKKEEDKTKEEEEQRRLRNIEWAKERRAEEQRQEALFWAHFHEECKRRGACPRCSKLPGYMRVKYVRHRGECPKGRR